MSSSNINNQWVTLGKITGVFGIKGWVKIHSFTEPASNLFDYSPMRLFNTKTQRTQKIQFQTFQKHGKGYIASIDSCDDRDKAMLYTQQEIQVPRDALAELDEGDYYWSDIVGLSVWVKVDEAAQSSEGMWQCLGCVDHLLETGANDVLVVVPSPCSIDDRERLIPFVDHVILRISLNEQRIELDWESDF